MKTRFLVVLIILLAGLVGRSCQDPDEACNCSSLIMGDISKVGLQIHDVILSGDYNGDPDVINIDIDGDGEDDYRFSSHLWGSPGQGMHPTTNVLCLNSSSFLNVTLFQDTSFLHIDTSVYLNDPVEVVIRQYYTCERMDEDDSVLGIRDWMQLEGLSLGDTLSVSGTWAADTIDLGGSWGGNMPEIIGGSEDTIIIKETQYRNDCHAFPTEQVWYIGLKKVTASGERLGWIKISLPDRLRIMVIESALK
jgi:hypothetical protein